MALSVSHLMMLGKQASVPFTFRFYNQDWAETAWLQCDGHSSFKNAVIVLLWLRLSSHEKSAIQHFLPLSRLICGDELQLKTPLSENQLVVLVSFLTKGLYGPYSRTSAKSGFHCEKTKCWAKVGKAAVLLSSSFIRVYFG